MRPIITALIILALVTGFIFLLPTPTEEKTTSKSGKTEASSFRLTNIHLFDGQQWIPNTQVTVINGHIANNDSQQSLPVVDGEHGYLIPGLIDAHTHTWGEALQQALNFGVTTELDMFTDYRFLQQHKTQRDNVDQVKQADLFSAGTLATSPKGHGTEYGIPVPTLTSPDEAEAFVQARLKEGSDYIKIVYDRTHEKSHFTSIDKATMSALITAAHKHNRLAVVHISNMNSALDAVEAGADGLVHTFADQAVSDELLTALKKQNTFVIPTLSVIASFANQQRGQALIDDPTLSSLVTPSIKQSLLQSFSFGDHGNHTFANALDNTRKMHQAGILLLAGTDAPNPGTAHGISMHDEVELLVDSGLSPTEALTAATFNAANAFGLTQRGHLKPGARADMILLSADPAKDIKHTRAIKTIWKNGYVHTIEKDKEVSEVALKNNGVVSHFPDANLQPQNGLGFSATSDNMMKGNSTASINWVAEGCQDAGALAVKGTVGNQFPFPWAGVFFMLGESMQKGVNLTAQKSIEFQVKGQPGQYRLMVFTRDSQRPAEVGFEVSAQCQPIQIDFAQLDAVDWGNVTGFAWVAGKQQSDFHFTLDNIVIN
ncbi:amidohydrolase family protein [Pleionea sp. CnH1-48]|uniref:amidohydrolase family protein n=1 Tax=Pleionea sp. CnH1-48 TaxID=2954494 RepID=UPI00209832EE|nr:amidohydrolase family protein [Pleionea sp. CnH1-48]MCO7225834.1 amidohydrolase family protein [Pleionea sp. CnH1-48]